MKSIESWGRRSSTARSGKRDGGLAGRTEFVTRSSSWTCISCMNSVREYLTFLHSVEVFGIGILIY